MFVVCNLVDLSLEFCDLMDDTSRLTDLSL